jgi:hypothetical protein
LGGAGSSFYGLVRNDSGGETSFTVDAECLTFTGAKGAYGLEVAKTINPGASVGIQATCPQGTLITGGVIEPGNSDTRVNVLMYDYSPTNSTMWQEHGVNLGTITTQADLGAQCLSFS